MASTTISTEDLWPDFVSEITNPAADMELQTNSQGSLVLHQQSDRIYTAARNVSGSIIRAGWIDPLLEDGALPSTNFTNVIDGTTLINWQHAYVGQWNRTANTQKLYSRIGTGTAGKAVERDQNTLQLLDSDPFPNVRSTCIATGSSSDGYYVMISDTWIIFEEQGKIYGLGTCRAGGTSWSNCFFEIDIATGLAVPILGIPGKATAAPTIYQEPELFGDEVTWNHLQYVNDDDSSHISPKGILIISHTAGMQGVIGPPDTDEKVYVRIVEWNPNGVDPAPGTPNRVHKRITLTSRCEFDETPAGTHFSNYNLCYHPLSDRLYWIPYYNLSPSKPLGVNVVYRFSLVPALASITAPTPERTPRTAGTTAFFVEALGTLGERIPAVSVQFSLETNSTVLELMDTSTGVGGASAPVARIPVGHVKGVYEDDGAGNLTLLTPVTHYTYAAATGIFAGAAPYWRVGYDYYVSYAHFEDDVTPALGTLLLPLVETDNEGRARTRVRYADNDDLVGLYDKLSATTDI